jgi:hypothetical protein
MTKEGETIDPIIEIQCMNEKKFTTAKDDIGAAGVVSWQEHIFFEPRNVVSIIIIYIIVCCLNLTYAISK